MNRTFRFIKIVVTAIALLSLFCTSSAWTAPQLKSAVIKYGGSIRVPENAWATFAYRLVNPDEEAVSVRLQLHPDKQRGGVIYDHEVSIPPKGILINQIPVTLTRDDTYVAELFVNGNLTDSTSMIVSVASPSDRLLLILNDDSEQGVGNFSRNENLHAKYLTVPLGAISAPEQWSGYDRANMVIAVRPNWALMNTRKIQALRDYVYKGGSLALIDPYGIEAAAQTDLAGLLPINPIRTRNIDHLGPEHVPGTEVTAQWENGAPFLESIPTANGLTTMAIDGFPLMRWHRVGLGRVVVCCANPSYKGTPGAMYDAMWRHLLRFSGSGKTMISSQGSRPLSKTIDTLTGLRIPQRGPIVKGALGYLAAVGLIVLIGILTRKRVQSWFAVVALSIGATIFIFSMARKQHENQTAHSASILSFLGPADGPSEEITTLFTRSESTVSLAGTNADSRFRDIPPPPRDLNIHGGPQPSMNRNSGKKNGKRGGAKKKQVRSSGGLREPLPVTIREGIPRMENTILRGNSVKMHAMLQPGEQLLLSQDAPLLPQSGESQWQLPDTLAASTGAAVLFESGIASASINNGSAEIPAGLRTDEKLAAKDLKGLQETAAEMNLPAPVLLLSTPLTGTAEEKGIPKQFELSGRNVRLVPMRERVESSVSLAFGRMPIRPEGGLARSLYNRNGWVMAQQRTTPNTYEFITWLPPTLLRLDPNQIRVRFAGDNRGRNITFDVFLRPWNAPEKDTAQDVKATSSEDGVWSFDASKHANLIDPSDGRIRVVLVSTPIKKIVDPVAALRVNSWIILDFETAVDGQIAAPWTGEL